MRRREYRSARDLRSARRLHAEGFPPHARAAVLDRAARLVADNVYELAAFVAAEADKPIKSAAIEARRCAGTLLFSAGEARRLTGATVPMEGSESGVGKLGVVLRLPFGVIGAISPFNFPLNLVAHKVKVRRLRPATR